MSLPRFHSRAVDALMPALSVSNRDFIAERLTDVRVGLSASGPVFESDEHRAGFLLAANLLARLYPRISVNTPKDLSETVAKTILSINPRADVAILKSDSDFSLSWGKSGKAESVTVCPTQWCALVDVDHTEGERLPKAAAPAALAAACFGAAELFRWVFSDLLGEPRRRDPRPGAFDLLTSSPEIASGVPTGLQGIDVGSFSLIGAGAIGQATVLTLEQAKVLGVMTVVDAEKIELSNLQRYVLAHDVHVGLLKTQRICDQLAGGSITVRPIPTLWGADERTGPGCRVALVAVDSAATRIDVQAALPERIYNAWTQPNDLGWSRHEVFGQDPCLACLYMPTGALPGRHQVVAVATKQNELRALAYLVSKTPIDQPLLAEAIQAPAGTSLPADSARWTTVSILDDISVAFNIDRSSLTAWESTSLDHFYRQGLCGGAVIGASTMATDRDVIVPMAHQSALAGVMLATQLIIASNSDLKAARSRATEGRLDLRRGLPQTAAWPRQRTPFCLCSDRDYLATWREWQG